VSSGSITDSTERRQQRGGGAAQKTRVGVSKPVILRRPRLDPKISGTHRYILTHNGRRILPPRLCPFPLLQSKSPKTRANRSGECGGA
jgi:hypothetical protein